MNWRVVRSCVRPSIKGEYKRNCRTCVHDYLDDKCMAYLKRTGAEVLVRKTGALK